MTPNTCTRDHRANMLTVWLSFIAILTVSVMFLQPEALLLVEFLTCVTAFTIEDDIRRVNNRHAQGRCRV